MTALASNRAPGAVKRSRSMRRVACRLLAIGSEPLVSAVCAKSAPQELLTQSPAILGQGQSRWRSTLDRESLRRRTLDLHDSGGVLQHMLAGSTGSAILHFHRARRSDTLDYAATDSIWFRKLSSPLGAPVGKLADRNRIGFVLPEGYAERESSCRESWLCQVRGSPPIQGRLGPVWQALRNGCAGIRADVLVDDSDFTARPLNTLCGVTVTRQQSAKESTESANSRATSKWAAAGHSSSTPGSNRHPAPPLAEVRLHKKKSTRCRAREDRFHRWLE